MFTLFKKKSKVAPWVIALLKNVFSTSPEYKKLEKQVQQGLLTDIWENLVKPYGYAQFKYDLKVMPKYRDEKEPPYRIKGFKAFDKRSGKYIDFDILIAKGTITSLTPFSFEFDIDPDDLKIENLEKIAEPNKAFDKIMHMFKPEELDLINSSDVYEMEEEQGIYHIKVVDGGHSIGIDEKKNVYLIIEDPYHKRLLKSSLIEILRKGYQ